MPADVVVPLDKAELPYLDTSSETYLGDPFPVIARTLADHGGAGRVMRSPVGVEIGRYDAGREILGDRRIQSPDAAHFRELGAGPLLVQYLSEGKMTALQGEKHKHHRRLLTPPLAPGAVEGQRAMYDEVANGLIDTFVATGSCDLVAEFGHTYPIRILCRALGVPVEDIPIFEQVTLDFALINAHPLLPHVDRIENALQVLLDYSTELLDRRTRSQGDFIDDLVRFRREGTMTSHEVVWSLVTLLQAAHFTTRNQTASIVRLLIENDLWDEVAADPSLVPAVVEEGMRYYPTVLGITRMIRDEPVIVEGIELPVGTVLRWNAMAASRDPDRFADPDRFDLRRDTKARIPFGWGIHKCLGQHMARADIEIAIGVLTTRLENPRILEPVTMVATGALWGPKELHLSFEV